MGNKAWYEAKRMKSINVTFEDAEYEQLDTAKNESGASSWREFFLMIFIPKKLNGHKTFIQPINKEE